MREIYLSTRTTSFSFSLRLIAARKFLFFISWKILLLLFFFTFIIIFLLFFPTLILFPSVLRLTSFSWFSPHSTIFHSSLSACFQVSSSEYFSVCFETETGSKDKDEIFIAATKGIALGWVSASLSVMIMIIMQSSFSSRSRDNNAMLENSQQSHN